MKQEYPTLPSLDAARLLREYHIRPEKSLGQNFLQDDTALRKIVDASQVASTDTVLEIGPGLGSLTRYLSLSAREVVAVELDENLLPILASVLKGFDNVRVIHGDILKLSVREMIEDNSYLVIANIPYYITSAIIRFLLENNPKPRRVVLTIQKEVAQRICAKEGDLSLLALSVQVFGRPQIVDDISSEAFYPAPNVNSSIIKFDTYTEPVIPEKQLDKFFLLAKAGFSQKRKTLRNSLSGGLSITTIDAEKSLGEAGIDPMRRAETLSISEWATLTTVFDNKRI